MQNHHSSILCLAPTVFAEPFRPTNVVPAATSVGMTPVASDSDREGRKRACLTGLTYAFLFQRVLCGHIPLVGRSASPRHKRGGL